MKKMIPVFLAKNNTQVYQMPERAPMITRVYEKFQNIYRIKKIYHVRGKGAWIETERMPYSI